MKYIKSFIKIWAKFNKFLFNFDQSRSITVQSIANCEEVSHFVVSFALSNNHFLFSATFQKRIFLTKSTYLLIRSNAELIQGSFLKTFVNKSH